MGKSRTTGGTKPTTRSLLGAHIGERTAERLREGVPEDVAASIIATSSSAQEAAERLGRSRDQDMTKTVVHAKREIDPDNPYDFED
jgi:hypothetical protein